MSDVSIRRMTADDVAGVWEIENATFPTPWSMRDFEHEMRENPCARYLVAVRDDRIVGFAGIHIILDEGHITNVAVRPGFRNRKIAEGIIGVLLDHTLKEGIRHHTLEVRRDNDPAIGLYEKFGFEVEGVRKDYYKFEGQDALIMWRHATDEEIAEAEAIAAARAEEAATAVCDGANDRETVWTEETEEIKEND